MIDILNVLALKYSNNLGLIIFDTPEKKKKFVKENKDLFFGITPNKIKFKNGTRVLLSYKDVCYKHNRLVLGFVIAYGNLFKYNLDDRIYLRDRLRKKDTDKIFIMIND